MRPVRRNARSAVAAVATLVAAPLLLAVDCRSDVDDRRDAVVVKRTPRGERGVDLLVEYPDGRRHVESYQTRQPMCQVGARWPACAER